MSGKTSNTANRHRNRQIRLKAQGYKPVPGTQAWLNACSNPRKCDRPLGPAEPTRHEWRMMKQAARLCELRAREAVQPGPILSDNPEWCAFDYQPNRKPIPYRALTSTGHMQAPRTVREWAGGVLSAAAERQRQERIEGKQALTSYNNMRTATA